MVGGVASVGPRKRVESIEPDIPRLATDADRVLAGQLSTVWPMSNRHPQDALHLAVFVNDLFGLLVDYAEHKIDCPRFRTMGDDGGAACICGLDNVLAGASVPDVRSALRSLVEACDSGIDPLSGEGSSIAVALITARSVLSIGGEVA